MNDQEQSPGTSTPSPEYPDWREQRRAERWARREARRQGRGGRPFGWIGATILILVGLALLLQSLGLPVLANWWALFLLIPAFWAFFAGWQSYRDNGRLTRGGARSLAGGILLTILTVILLLNLNLGLWLAVLLIVAGLVLLGMMLVPA